MDTQTQTPTVQTKSVFRSIRSVLTENQIAGLIDLRERTSAIQWQAGDLVNEIYTQVMANNQQASIMDVCCFISDEIYNLFAPNTLRIYSAVAKFYPQHVRAGIMPFWVFRYATRFENNWIWVFTWANEFMDLHARLPYEREVRAHFEPAVSLLHTIQTPPTETMPKQTPPEAQAIEQAIPGNGLKSILRGLLSLIPSVMPEVKDPEATRLLSQIAVLSRQLLEQYL